MKLVNIYRCLGCGKEDRHESNLTPEELAELDAMGIKIFGHKMMEKAPQLTVNHICESDLNNNTFHKISKFQLIGIELGEKEVHKPKQGDRSVSIGNLSSGSITMTGDGNVIGSGNKRY